MPRLPSIPDYLLQKIQRRWLRGESPQQILDWINGSNRRRKQPVHTTRSSVERCLERISQGESVLSGAAACRRLRCLAPSLVEDYEKVVAGYKECVAEADELDGSASWKMRLEVKGRALTRLDVGLSRQLRLAGCTGRSAERLLDEC